MRERAGGCRRERQAHASGALQAHPLNSMSLAQSSAAVSSRFRRSNRGIHVERQQQGHPTMTVAKSYSSETRVPSAPPSSRIVSVGRSCARGGELRTAAHCEWHGVAQTFVAPDHSPAASCVSRSPVASRRSFRWRWSHRAQPPQVPRVSSQRMEHRIQLAACSPFPSACGA